jgi:hypothetical protein
MTSSENQWFPHAAGPPGDPYPAARLFSASYRVRTVRLRLALKR